MQVNIKIIQINVLDQVPNIYKAGTITYEQKGISIGCKYKFFLGYPIFQGLI